MSATNSSPGAANLDATQGPSPGGDGPVVEFKNVSITFDVKPVLKDISFSVDRGETLVILGPAGCGKSVLLKLADGLILPDSGSIKIFGQEITTMPEREQFKLRAHIGIVFQESALFDSLNVEDNIAFRLKEEHVPEAEAHTRVLEALKFVDLEGTSEKFPSELSGGMRRRVSIARAIISHPDLILYDSPTGGLDPITSTTIIELVMKQRDVSHTTSLMVTHRLQDAFMLATHRYDTAAGGMTAIPKDADGHNVDHSTRFLMLNEGGIVFHGNTEELINSDDPWIKEYLS